MNKEDLISAENVRSLQVEYWVGYRNKFDEIVQRIREHIEVSSVTSYIYKSKDVIAKPVIDMLKSEGFDIKNLSDVELEICW